MESEPSKTELSPAKQIRERESILKNKREDRSPNFEKVISQFDIGLGDRNDFQKSGFADKSTQIEFVGSTIDFTLQMLDKMDL